MIYSDFYGKYLDIAFYGVLIGLIFLFIYSPISSLIFGLSGSIISFCWLARDLKKYGLSGYNRSIIKRYGVLILLFLLSVKAGFIGVILFLIGYVVGQWYMIWKVWRSKDGTRT
ncbi:MAG: hypothetical protein ACP5K6_06850 [Dictyoglomus sp.]|uniref:hypothetical protein n=1 Tax=Dictyoglomus sp. TaxID=28205 RepID=UPI003C99D01F